MASSSGRAATASSAFSPGVEGSPVFQETLESPSPSRSRIFPTSMGLTP